jgi:hypothetical protein
VECLGTLREETPLGEWQNNHLTKVCSRDARSLIVMYLTTPCPDMLTPADQPLDKLQDLSADEMYDYDYLSSAIAHETHVPIIDQP